ncbi:unnamed protein product [Pseudo-nitzschia multistriata]|uniref:EF-hand domain-containing protein n=1 Tax=Pseudo-nitzschia multistriata TaxID=183589 RepID=A0A448Z132_9STRA|nr:unnamed protein product [Pseudo-nitzschia multistriata]
MKRSTLISLSLVFFVVADATTIQPKKMTTRPTLVEVATTKSPTKNRVSIVSCRRATSLVRVLPLRGGDGSRDATLFKKSWKIVSTPWKYAVEKVTPQTSNIRVSHGTNVDENRVAEQGAEITSESLSTTSKSSHYSPLQMYASCMGIVTLWMMTGTLFYSFVNDWPIPQSFFYAVDAGMSIGFCTDVVETKLVSKSFTIIFIVLGASVVGGALALFMQDLVEGVIDRERKNNSSILTKGYELMIEKETFQKFDADNSGTLSRSEFSKLLRATSSNVKISEDDIDVLWTKFDGIEDGAIRFEEFVGTSRCINELIASLNDKTTAFHQDELGGGKQSTATTLLGSILSRTSSVPSRLKAIWQSENRIYGVFIAWVLLGIIFGMIDQHWDPITSTHFAISALATGGLTGPAVNSDGILPARPSIFCGCYCLFGIPLMAITFGHFAQRLVANHVAAMEEWGLTRPMTATDYKIARQYLTREITTSPPLKWIRKHGRQQQQSSLFPSSSGKPSSGLRLSDFVVLQLLRQGKISVRTLDILRNEFDLLDKDGTGLLTLEEATTWSTDGREEKPMVGPL